MDSGTGSEVVVDSGDVLDVGAVVAAIVASVDDVVVTDTGSESDSLSPAHAEIASRTTAAPITGMRPTGCMRAR